MNRYQKNIIKSTLLWDLYKKIKLCNFRKKWIIRNRQNQSFPMNVFDPNTVEVGKASYGELNVISFDKESKLIIGNYVSIAEQVTFLLAVEHYVDHVSTYPFRVKMLETTDCESFSKGNIVIDDDVWIGFGATILSGVHVGKGAVIAAGSVVTKDIPAYSICGGVPARIINYRFKQDIRDELAKIDYGNLTVQRIKRDEELLYTQINSANGKQIVEQLLK